MVLGDGSRLPRADHLPYARALEQLNRIRHHLRPLVERLVPAAQRLRRHYVYALDYSGLPRTENQRALWDSGASVV